MVHNFDTNIKRGILSRGFNINILRDECFNATWNLGTTQNLLKD